MPFLDQSVARYVVAIPSCKVSLDRSTVSKPAPVNVGSNFGHLHCSIIIGSDDNEHRT